MHIVLIIKPSDAHGYLIYKWFRSNESKGFSPEHKDGLDICLRNCAQDYFFSSDFS